MDRDIETHSSRSIGTRSIYVYENHCTIAHLSVICGGNSASEKIAGTQHPCPDMELIGLLLLFILLLLLLFFIIIIYYYYSSALLLMFHQFVVVQVNVDVLGEYVNKLIAYCIIIRE